MAKTYIDEVVEFPAKAVQKIGTSQKILALLTNNPEIEVDSEEADGVFDRYIFDYGYVDDTTVDASAYICVEVEMSKSISTTMQSISLYVTVVCHKNYMSINPKTFPSTIGNRRDNLVRYIDKELNGSDLFGVGRLTMLSVKTVAAPAGFSAREITYQVPDFLEKDIQ